MGYQTRYSGEIVITPPLKWSEMKDDPYLDDQYGDVMILVEEEPVDTDEGVLVTKLGYAIVPIWEDPYKGYDIESHIQKIVSQYPTHAFSGAIRGEGEDSGDMRRYVITTGGKVEVQTAQWTWPDGTTD
jgi:hypothetical protein